MLRRREDAGEAAFHLTPSFMVYEDADLKVMLSPDWQVEEMVLKAPFDGQRRSDRGGGDVRRWPRAGRLAALPAVPGRAETSNLPSVTRRSRSHMDAALPRVGIGYDIHRLAAGRRLVLGGVEIPFDRGLDGHSDADALLHAIMDALLGAAGLGDIGQHFPPGDPRYKDASSLALLARVAAFLAGWATPWATSTPPWWPSAPGWPRTSPRCAGASPPPWPSPRRAWASRPPPTRAWARWAPTRASPPGPWRSSPR